jgi:ubiquinone/menaquinone biosynthesis C-methylase UbiE
MGLDENTLKQVSARVAEITSHGGVVLDAATGAGETTAQIAAAMKGGKLITVDSDPASWEEWAKPRLERAGLLDRVEFRRDDLRHLSSVESSACELVVSHSTLSALGMWAIDATHQFHRVLKPGGVLVIADLLSEEESAPDGGNVSALSWRLMKAAAHLAGGPHYEELPLEWVKAHVREAGFQIDSVELRPQRPPASRESFEEWSRAEPGEGIGDADLREAFRTAWGRYVEQAKKNGLTNKEGSYTLWARR